jgi:Sigma-70, region 4
VRNHLGAAFRNFLGLSEAETAATLGCALGTVKSRLSRAIGGLRKRMEEATARQTRRGLLAGGQRNANLSRRARAAAELLPGGALLWEHEGRALLMRTELPKAEAIQLAASVS